VRWGCNGRSWRSEILAKTCDADALIGGMAAAGLPMIDTRARPGSRRVDRLPHPRALGGVLMHVVQRDA
jgi:hypothetical protein